MKHKNEKKDTKLRNFPLDSIETALKSIEGLLSFSFKYLDSSQGDKITDLSKDQIDKFVEKLKWYSNETRMHWETTRIGGKNGMVLEVYGAFPSKSDFYHPSFVPADVRWARFRMEGDMRLIGFMIDKKDAVNSSLNTDVFYVVFLDLYHAFYKTGK